MNVIYISNTGIAFEFKFSEKFGKMLSQVSSPGIHKIPPRNGIISSRSWILKFLREIGSSKFSEKLRENYVVKFLRENFRVIFSEKFGHIIGSKFLGEI